jgi:hypothetical protein
MKESQVAEEPKAVYSGRNQPVKRTVQLVYNNNLIFICLQDLAVVYQKALPNREHASSDCLDFCLVDIRALVEGFVNACCFHLWGGLL